MLNLLRLIYVIYMYSILVNNIKYLVRSCAVIARGRFFCAKGFFRIGMVNRGMIMLKLQKSGFNCIYTCK